MFFDPNYRTLTHEDGLEISWVKDLIGGSAIIELTRVTLAPCKQRLQHFEVSTIPAEHRCRSAYLAAFRMAD